MQSMPFIGVCPQEFLIISSSEIYFDNTFDELVQWYGNHCNGFYQYHETGIMVLVLLYRYDDAIIMEPVSWYHSTCIMVPVSPSDLPWISHLN